MYNDTITAQRRRIDDHLAEVRFDAETKRIEAQRQREYEATGARQVLARWLDDDHTTAEVLVYRGVEIGDYIVRRRSPSAFRLAFLAGENGRPLFNGGVTICKGRAA